MSGFYSYSPHGECCFVIEGSDGSLLIGDQLPSTEAEAKLLCRCANIAHDHATKLVKETVRKKLAEVLA